MKKFAVVHFLKDNSLEAVPRKWIDETKKTCKFPVVFSPSFSKLRGDSESSPLSNWKSYKIEVKYRSNNYLKVAQKANELQFTSNVESSSDSSVDGNYYVRKKRKQKPNPNFKEFVINRTVLTKTQTKKSTDSYSSTDIPQPLNTSQPTELIPIYAAGKAPETVDHSENEILVERSVSNSTEERNAKRMRAEESPLAHEVFSSQSKLPYIQNPLPGDEILLSIRAEL
ncbi:unnamed protein product, partial [Allacma fusca]